MQLSIITAIAMGVGISACCGFRVFIPLLVTSVAAYFKWVPMSAGMEWVGTLPAIICFATATVFEVVAYYIPFLDNLLDTIAAPLAVIAGTVLATSIIPIDQSQPILKWGIGLLAGGATAGTIQLGSGLLRMFTTKATVGSGNAVVSTGENIAAVTGSLLSFVIPIIIAIILLTLVAIILYRGGLFFSKKKWI